MLEDTILFFFSSRRRHTRCSRDWSSDVCSSDLVVVWRVHGPFVQIMDPAVGRVWMDRHAFLRSLYIHQQEGPRAAWEEWSQSAPRSEERRVGKEGRSRWSPYH